MNGTLNGYKEIFIGHAKINLLYTDMSHLTHSMLSKYLSLPIYLSVFATGFGEVTQEDSGTKGKKFFSDNWCS